MFIWLSFCAIFAAGNAGSAEPALDNMIEKAPGSDDGFAYAFSGGWPQNFFPENAFLGAVQLPDFFQNLQQQHAQLQSSIMNLAANPPIPDFPKNPGKDFNAAFAGAAISPQGVYQAAQIFPENPMSPNIETRFASGNPSPDGGNFYAVVTSSQAGSQTINGKTTGYRKASTTVNDNGKVTTYTAQDP